MTAVSATWTMREPRNESPKEGIEMNYEDAAHAEWHRNSGVPMGTPGCPQDACHPDDDERYDDGGVLSPSTAISTRMLSRTGTVEWVGEMSDLGGPLCRVFDDACDEGFTLVSERTGKAVTMVADGEKRDGEGELMWIDFAAAGQDRKIGIAVRLFND